MATKLEANIPEASIEIILEEHQSGLYGKVFKGRQTALDRIVAVKIIRPEWPDAADITEHAKAIARAGSHPNIVTVHCVEPVRVPGFNQPQTAMIMEWLDGERLDRRLRGAKFDEEQVRRICIGILDGVQHMHANGTAHGDLHAGNVFVVSNCTPKIFDIDPNKDITLARLSNGFKAKNSTVERRKLPVPHLPCLLARPIFACSAQPHGRGIAAGTVDR